MGEHDSYHQRISAEEAEKRLKKYDGNRCYLTRFSQNNNHYVLSVYQKIPTQEIEHYGIDIQDGKYKIQGKEDVFNDVTQMLKHYEQKRLDPAFKNIGKMFTEEDYLSALNRNPLMGEHPSYHQSMGAEEAEQRLKKCDGDCCYLTRFREENRKYMLSVSQKRPTRSIKHFQIDIRDGKCSIFERTEVFDDITQMLEHYEYNRLDPAFKTIGKMFTEEDYTIALNKTLMEEHTSYHKTISAEEAEQRLKKCGRDRCYLTRYCDENKNYVLSMRQKMPTRVIKHFKIEVQNGKCNIHNKPDVFDDIPQMLQHYEHNRLDPDFETIGKRFTEDDCRIIKKLMEEHTSYHQTISAKEAEQRLKKCGGDRCYLTRYCDVEKNYVLSVHQKIPTRVIKHFKIEVQNGKCNIHDNTDVFDDIPQMLQHYEHNRLDHDFETIDKRFTEDDYTIIKTLIEEHTSYHKTISVEEAEQRLKKCGGDRCYLTRYCDVEKNYVLSVSQKMPTRVIKHFKIEVQNGKCNIHDNTDVFDDIPQMLQHYEHNRLDPDFETIGRRFTEDDCTIIKTLMEEHTSYHKTISAEEAEQRLKKCGGDRCYLTRYCDLEKNYVLSVSQKMPTRVTKHFKIEVQNGKCNIHDNTDVFDDIPQMLQHYEHNRLDPDFETIGKRFTEDDCRIIKKLMEEHTSYHKTISVEEAEQRLKKCGRDRCYLTHYCDENKNYVLSVRQKMPTRVIKHFKIEVQNGKCNIHDNTDVFDDIPQMLQHYEHNRLDPDFETIDKRFTEDDYTIIKTLMEEHTSYHQTISAKEAEQRLKKCGGDRCYLTRYCDVEKNYVLSVRQKIPTRVIKHFKIEVQNGKCNIHDNTDVFDDIPQMLQHYEHNRLDPDFETIGKRFTEEDCTIIKTLIEEHTSYHKTISAEEAEQRLKKCGGDRCYLTRYCDLEKNYVLSVSQKMPTRVTKHFKIEVQNGKCNIHDNTDVFDDIPQMLQHYEHNRLDPDFETIGKRFTEDDCRIIKKLMEEHTSYHKTISVEEAEQRLKKCGRDRCYLTRYCDENKNYVLSVRQKMPTRVIKHFKIEVQNGKCNIHDNTDVFDDIPQMLQHYEHNRLDPDFETIDKRFTEDDYTIIKTLMEEHTSYHQTISAKEAEQRLKKCGGDRCYLTRYCDVEKNYVLSVRQKIPTRVIKHFKIEVQNGKCNIHDNTDVFDDISQMLQHYEHNRLDNDFETIGKRFTEENCTIIKTLIEEHTSYHKTISAEEAEQRLKKCGGDRCYLTRYCDLEKNYVLSVSQKMPTRVTKHFKIEVQNGKCNIHDNTDVFDDIPQMLQHYEHNRLDPDFETIGRRFTEDDCTIIKTLMEKHTSYHKTISAEEAKQRLKKCGGDRCYLTRYCDLEKNYVLSVSQKMPTRVTKHFKIEVQNGKCNIHKKPDVFNDITQMLQHYEHNQLDSAFMNIGTRYTEESYNSSKGCQIL